MSDPLPNRAKNNKKGKALRARVPREAQQNCMARLIGTLSPSSQKAMRAACPNSYPSATSG